jgi:hypothetical protein
MLMHKTTELVSSPNWLYEAKRGGFQIIATVRDGSLRLFSANSHSFTRLFGLMTGTLRGGICDETRLRWDF